MLSACGFRPLYGTTNTLAGDTPALEQIWIDTIPNAPGLQLRNNLIDRFYHHGMPQNARYVLNITLYMTSRDLDLQKDDTTTRAQLVYRADYTLTERDTRRVIEKNSLRAVASYNILSSQYTTIVTYNEAQRLVLDQLADKLTLRMGVVLSEKSDKID